MELHSKNVHILSYDMSKKSGERTLTALCFGWAFGQKSDEHPPSEHEPPQMGSAL